MTPLTTLRYYGNAQVLVGHFVLLYFSMFWGLVLCFTANAHVVTVGSEA